MEDKWEKNYQLENLVIIIEGMIQGIIVVLEMTETMRIEEVFQEKKIVEVTISMNVGNKTIN